MQQIQLNVDDEIKAFGDVIKLLVVDIKAKKSVGAILADALPQLLPALAGLSNVGADIKKVDNQVYLVKALAEALEPAPVP